jgi:hypothetical protein
MRNYEINIPNFEGFLNQKEKTKVNELNKSDVLSSLPSDDIIEKIAIKAMEKNYAPNTWESNDGTKKEFDSIKYGMKIMREFLRRQIA